MEKYLHLICDAFEKRNLKLFLPIIVSDNCFLDFIKTSTSFLDKAFVVSSLQQRLWHIQNKVYDISKCLCCNRENKFKSTYTGYAKYCSRVCAAKTQMKGCGNNMYGKSTVSVWTEKYGKEKADEMWIESNKKRSDSGKISSNTMEFLENARQNAVGKNNPMYNKNFYSIWLEKYGKEIADEKMINYKQKHSILSSGKNNSMYGKPSPQGSGNGWSGWYKGWFFRSLRELSYMVNVIEQKKLQWESGEQQKYKISYTDYDGKKRNYFPDFVIEGSRMIECKPIRMHNSPKVIAKVKSAQKFCTKHGMTYEILEPTILSDLTILNLYNTGHIKFTKKYHKKFLKRLKDKED